MLLLLTYSQAHAVTVWYQPTPYPLKKSNGTAMPQDLNKIHIQDGWLNNSTNTGLVRDDKLQVGGGNDAYRSYLNWDLTGLPQNPTNVNLWFQFYSTGSTQTQFQFCIPNSDWNTSITWATQPSFLGCTGMYQLPAGGWNNWNITGWYQNWQNNTWGKYGMMINPQNNGGLFTSLRSSRYANDSFRPILQFDFTPTFELKMPLPGNYNWLLTNEIGGHECMGQLPWPDKYHQDDTGNYYAIDVSWKNFSSTGGPSTYGEFNTPVLAAASGKIVTARGGSAAGNPNGYYVVIDHDGDGNLNTGYSTRYLHLKNQSARKNGSLFTEGVSTVVQGDQIGIMGTTGKNSDGSSTSTGVHLHFGVKYNGNGMSSVPELTKVVMDGWLLKSFQTECAINSSGIPLDRIRYYGSGLIPTGN